jgi:HD superfamily phosphohydrolase
VSYLTPDPIYGTTELDPSLENLLRAPEIATEKRRLEGIKSLGLIHISFPSATHSKWEHHLGMAHLAGQTSLNKDNKKRLQLLCLLGGIGHLPYTYAAEEAVLLAARLSSTFRSSLQKVLDDVRQMVSDAADRAATAPYDGRIEGMQVIALHGWLTALKIKRLPQSIDIGDRRKLIRERISGDSDLNRLYRFIARLDYVQRDLYYTGLARFSLSTSGFLRRHQGAVDELFAAPASKLIDQIRSYLADSLYFEVRSASVESIFSKKLANVLVSGAISIEELLRWHDHDLDARFEEKAGKAWWREVIQTPYAEICRSKLYSYRLLYSDSATRNTFELEEKIVGLPEGKPKALTQYPEKRDFVVLCKSSFDPIERAAATEVILSVGSQPRRITPIAETISRIDSMRDRFRRRPRAKRTLGEDLITYVLNASVRSSYGRLSTVFAAGVDAMPNKTK